MESSTSLERWEEKVLAAPGAAHRVREIEDELRLAARASAQGAACTSTASVNERSEGER